MPPIIAIVGGLALALASGPLLTAGLIGLGVLDAMIGIGLTMVLNGVTQLFTKSPSAATIAHDMGSSSVSVRQPLAPWQVTYGRDRRGGVFTYIIASGADNEFINLVITMTGHQVNDIPNMYFDGIQIPVDINGDGSGQYAADSTGPAYVHWEKKFGAPGEPAFPGLIAQVPSQWTAQHRQDGRASCYVRLRWSATLFPNGMPTITFDIEGKLVFDPRTGLTGYTENVALCTRDYLTDPTIGLAETTANVGDDLIIAAANICDQSVALRAGGSEPQFNINGSFSLDQIPKDIITGLLSAMAGTSVYSEGRWKIYAAAFRGTTIPALTDNDLRDNIKVQTLLSARDLSNCVKGVYRDPLNQWQPGDFPCVQNAAYIAQDNGFFPTQNQAAWESGVGYVVGDCVTDNGSIWWCNTPHNSTPANEPETGAAVWTVCPQRMWLDLALAYTISPSMAQRLAKIQLEKIRRQIDVQFPGRLTALLPEVADVVAITRIERMGWNQKTFEVYDAQFKAFQGNNGANQLGCDLSLRETDAAIYAWNPTVDETVVSFVGTEITSHGGSNVLKYFYDAGVAANAVQYQVSVVVENNGTQPIFIGSNFSTSAAIPPGATQNIDLVITGDGVTHIQLRFLANAAGDAMDVFAVAPVIGKLSDGINLIPVANRDFSGWSNFGGSIIALTQGVPDLPNMTVVGAPSALVATSNTFTRLDGINKTRILATWTSPTDQFVLSGGFINLEVRDHADMIWRFAARVAGNATTAGYEEVINGHTYDVRISSENASGARSPVVEADNLVVSDAFSQITSTSFGNQGSIRPTALPVFTVATNSNNGAGVCTQRITSPATTIPLSDGTSFTMPAVDMSWTALAGVTGYTYGFRYKIADGTVHNATGTGVSVDADPNTTPLTTAASLAQRNQMAVNQNFDGYIPLTNGFLTVTTPNNGGTGGGSSGGSGGCVHENELVEAISDKDHGIYKLREIELGDLVAGRDLATGEKRFRRVIRIQREACNDWYLVNGRWMTSCEPVWNEDTMQWKPAHEMGTQQFGIFGYKVSLIVDGARDDDHNYILMPQQEGQPEMIVHNGVVLGS